MQHLPRCFIISDFLKMTQTAVVKLDGNKKSLTVYVCVYAMQSGIFSFFNSTEQIEDLLP